MGIRPDQSPSQSTSITSRSDPDMMQRPLTELTMPAIRPSAGAYAKVLLGIGLALSGSGCTPSVRPAGMPDIETTTFRETGELYKKAPGFGPPAAMLTLAQRVGTHSMEKINRDFSKSAGMAQVAANLTLLAQCEGSSISHINELYRNSSGTSVAATNLVTAATISGKSIDEINAMYRATNVWGAEAASILVLASACSNRTIQEMSALYKENPETGVPGAMLVLGSVLSGKPMAVMSNMYSQANGWYERSKAHLAILAAVHNTSIQHVNQLWNNAAGSNEASALLVQSALLAGTSIEHSNFNYHKSASWSQHGSAILVLTAATQRSAEREPGMGIVPLIYSRRNGKSTTDYSIPLIIPASAGFEGRTLPLGSNPK